MLSKLSGVSDASAFRNAEATPENILLSLGVIIQWRNSMNK